MLEVLIFDYSIKVWEVLAVLGVVLAALEIFAPGFILLPIGLAFLIAGFASIFLSTPLAVLSALAVSLCFLIWLFQFKLKMGLPGKAILESNVDGMVGSEVVIVSKIADDNMGDVKLYGDVWRAYSEGKRTYEENEKTLVIRVDGNKLVLD